MSTTRRYHYLLTQHTPNGRWNIEFGDFHKPTVQEERRAFCESYNIPKSQTMVLTTDTSQASIQRAVLSLNQSLGYAY